ncbi:Sulfoxide reductase catalytic subunit YedY precursor [Arthrobacter ulcerisalmonis]|uniref:Sulfoxide reductase catalytic subunit YedY n=2 Tax=Arthrobacter ulcerisalmonis TaxID=2483813 RepID=A0A3P5XNV0_9MICC|nr:molybdopterin-dependent oxidoreductase [Arthrobacter ulcerisalmonis]VDC30441.1 Sulfoxide reductase catalytic subunit YedY precursor [Arthrobacter ulcerisalmonis]
MTHDDGPHLGVPHRSEPHGEARPLTQGRRSWLAAAAGVVAVGGAVVIGELLAGFVSPSLSPLTAVGGTVIDAVPPGVKDWAISLFGTGDKAALLTGMALVIALLAALAGVVEDRRRFAGFAVVGVFGLAGVAAVLTRAQQTAVAAALPVLVAVLAGLLLRFLIKRLQAWAGGPATSAPATLQDIQRTGNPETARRRFLQTLAGGAVATAVGGALAGVWRGAAESVRAARAAVILPRPISAAPAIPAAADLGVAGVTALVTPATDFYRIDTALSVPTVNPETWTLKVTGLVDREVELNFADLLAKPMIERHITIACVSNNVGGDLIGNARWQGWPVRELMALAGPLAGADMVLSRSADGWTAGTPLEALTDSRDAMLVVGMNGEPLPVDHGFPVRMVVPGLYGYVSATKWLTELKVTRFADDQGYWTPRGWTERGPIKLSSRIDVPRSGRQVPAGTVVVGGVAWAQHTGVGAVEVRVNRGPWQAAKLAAGISVDTWYQWQLGLDLSPGQYEVQVRATDLAGLVQDEASRPPAPDGATGFHTIRVDVKS